MKEGTKNKLLARILNGLAFLHLLLFPLLFILFIWTDGNEDTILKIAGTNVMLLIIESIMYYTLCYPEDK